MGVLIGVLMGVPNGGPYGILMWFPNGGPYRVLCRSPYGVPNGVPSVGPYGIPYRRSLSGVPMGSLLDSLWGSVMGVHIGIP